MRLILAFAMLAMAAPLWAEEQSTLRYDVRLLGARVGIMTIAAIEKDNYYAAHSKFQTSGIVGALRHVSADVTVQGRVSGGTLKPHDYVEAIDDGSRVTNVQVRFSPGTPKLVSGDVGSSAPPAKPASLRQAIDPLTVLYAALRDQPRDEVCRFEADVFDGHRLARIALNRPKAQGDGVVCYGFYRRVAGYSKSERSSRQVAISVNYEPAGATMRAERVWVETKYGPAVMQRK